MPVTEEVSLCSGFRIVHIYELEKRREEKRVRKGFPERMVFWFLGFF